MIGIPLALLGLAALAIACHYWAITVTCRQMELRGFAPRWRTTRYATVSLGMLFMGATCIFIGGWVI